MKIKKRVINLALFCTIAILFSCFFLKKEKIRNIIVFNESGKPIDSVIIYTNKVINLKKSNLKIGEIKKFTIDISDYKLQGKEGFFFIKVYQGNYYLTRAFNYHDNWKMLPESNLYVYKDFIANGKMNNPKPIDTIQRKFRIKN